MSHQHNQYKDIHDHHDQKTRNYHTKQEAHKSKIGVI